MTISNKDYEELGRFVGESVYEPLLARIKALEAGPFKFVGTWTQGTEYRPRNVVQSGGSTWHCNERTTDKPGTTAAFTLMAKHGRDARTK